MVNKNDDTTNGWGPMSRLQQCLSAVRDLTQLTKKVMGTCSVNTIPQSKESHPSSKKERKNYLVELERDDRDDATRIFNNLIIGLKATMLCKVRDAVLSIFLHVSA